MSKLLNFKLDIVCDDAETLYSAMKACWDADGSLGVVTHYATEPDRLVLYWSALPSDKAEEVCKPLPFKMDLGAAVEFVRGWLGSDFPSVARPVGASVSNCLRVFHIQKDVEAYCEQVAVSVRRIWGIFGERKEQP